ncbi:hypothetical protein [Streptacidiphilus sp. EB129]|uniref:hypothetical protein n=1 Tax=Streptacidiphilus sp. EB129 TaxID=3156262 RepID=UPI003519C1F6
MAEQPPIGTVVHFTADVGTPCQPMYVHARLGTAHLRLADTPPGRPATRFWAACPETDGRDPHSWHPDCAQAT